MSTYLLTEKRTIRNVNQNKCGPLTNNIGWSLISQNTFLYRMKINYNRLPRSLTLCPKFKIFKKWLNEYSYNKEIRLPPRTDNVIYTHNDILDDRSRSIYRGCPEE